MNRSSLAFNLVDSHTSKTMSWDLMTLLLQPGVKSRRRHHRRFSRKSLLSLMVGALHCIRLISMQTQSSVAGVPVQSAVVLCPWALAERRHRLMAKLQLQHRRCNWSCLTSVGVSMSWCSTGSRLATHALQHQATASCQSRLRSHGLAGTSGRDAFGSRCRAVQVSVRLQRTHKRLWVSTSGSCLGLSWAAVTRLHCNPRCTPRCWSPRRSSRASCASSGCQAPACSA